MNAPTLKSGRPPVPRGSGELVLLVEDQDILRTALASLIELLGYDVRAFGDPREALGWVRDGGRPDVLLTDLTMPGLDGVELAAAIEGLVAPVALVFMSGTKRDALDLRARTGKPSLFLAKPFTLEALAHALSSTLTRAG